jgi:hypothetical protein
MVRTLYCLSLVQLFSCSPRVLEVKQTHYFHDNYLLFRKNGFYSNKALVLGVFRLPDFQRGRYAMQRDSVYFIRKKSRTDLLFMRMAILTRYANNFTTGILIPLRKKYITSLKCQRVKETGNMDINDPEKFIYRGELAVLTIS